MQSKVAPFAATQDSTYGRSTTPQAPESADGAQESPPADEGDLRLVIDEDPRTGAIVYARVNRKTGKIVAWFSRDAVIKMKDDADYSAGEVIRTRA